MANKIIKSDINHEKDLQKVLYYQNLVLWIIHKKTANRYIKQWI